MAEFSIFADPQDLNELWSIIFGEMGLKALPDPYFGNLPAPVFSIVDEVAAHLRDYPRIAPALGYFLISDEWSVEPLRFRRCDNNPNFEPHWYVMQRYGGPSIHFVPRFGYPWHNPSGRLIGGMFSDYPLYYSSVAEMDAIQRPAGLVHAMASIKRRLLDQGRYVAAASGKRAIAMRNALAAHRQGTQLRGGDLLFSANSGRSGRAKARRSRREH